MKIKTKFMSHVLLALIVIITAQAFSAAAPQRSEPQTVADFFLLVPERYVGYDLTFREGLVRGERRGTVIDLPNRYISWNASDNPEEFEFALFKKRNGKYIVAFSAPYDSAFPNSGRFVLLRYDRCKWRNVTRTLLPVKYDNRLTYNSRGRVALSKWRVSGGTSVTRSRGQVIALRFHGRARKDYARKQNEDCCPLGPQGHLDTYVRLRLCLRVAVLCLLSQMDLGI